jgi:hypothetical protein
VGEAFVIPNNLTELIVISGHDLELSFDADMDSGATVIFYWQRDGYALSAEKHKYKGSNTQILTILDVQSSDEGIYSLIIVMADVIMRSFNISISVGKNINAIID